MFCLLEKYFVYIILLLTLLIIALLMSMKMIFHLQPSTEIRKITNLQSTEFSSASEMPKELMLNLHNAF